MSKRDHSASLPVGHRCLGTQVSDRGLTEVLTSPNKHVAMRLADDDAHRDHAMLDLSKYVAGGTLQNEQCYGRQRIRVSSQ